MKGMYRSRSLKRHLVKTAKRTELHFKKKKKGMPTCAECGAVLHGVSMRNRKYSRPLRKYGGYICPNCLKKILVESVRT